MAVSRVTGQDVANSSSAATVSATYPGATTKGNLLIASVYTGNTNVPTISGWQSVTTGINSNTAQMGVFWKLADGTETSITAASTSSTLMRLHLYEYSGFNGVVNVDVQPAPNGTTAGSTSWATPSLTTYDSADLLFGAVGLNGDSTSPSFSGLNLRGSDSRLIDGDLVPGTVESAFTGTASWTSTLKPSSIVVSFSPTPSTTIVRRGSSSISSTSITIPGTYQAGDLILIQAFRNSSTSVPSVPSGYTSLGSSTGNTCAAVIGYKIAQSSSETSGTWSNATGLIATVYRGAGEATIVSPTDGLGTSITFGNWPTGLYNQTGGSWVVGFAGHRDTGTDLSVAPSGMTTVTFMNTGTGGHFGSYDTNGAVTSWAGGTSSVGGTSAGFKSLVVELLPNGYQATGVQFKGDIWVASTVTGQLPAHTVGDLILCYAYRNATTAPTNPTGFTSLSTQSANSNSFRLSSKLAAIADTTVTATNASLIIVAIYRNANAGVAGSSTAAASTTPGVAGISTLGNATGTSWVARFVGSAQNTSMSYPSNTGETGRDTASRSGAEAVFSDSNGTVTAWSSSTVTLGTSAVSASVSVELLETASIVQTVTGTISSATSGTASLAPITAGDLLVVAIGGGSLGATISSVTDGTNTYTKLDQYTDGSAFDGELWYCLSATAAAASTLTITASLSDSFSFVFREYSGSYTPLDQHTVSHSTGSSLSSGNVTTTTATQLVIGWATQGAGGAFTAGSGYTDITNATIGTTATALEDTLLASTATKAATFTGSGTTYAAGIATFTMPSTGSTVTKTQTGVARIANIVTKTQGAVARIATNKTATQTAKARVATNITKTQSAIARVANVFTKTQAAVARVANVVTKTQTATANIATGATRTNTQSAVARVAIIGTATQPAKARIAKTVTATQSAAARVARILTKTQGAIARISQPLTNQQTAKARIANGESATQTAKAYIIQSGAVTKTQTAVARIAVKLTTTQSATARVARVLTKTQSAIARISQPLTKTQSALARIALNKTSTQSATARIAVKTSTTQSAKATITQNGVVTKTQSATAHIMAVVTTTQTALARIAVKRSLTQSAAARISITGSKTQTALARVAIVGTAQQTARSRIAANLTKTQAARATIASTVTHVQTALARIANRFSTTQSASGRIANAETKTQSAKARVAIVGSHTQPAKARLIMVVTATQTAAARIVQPRSTIQTATATITFGGSIAAPLYISVDQGVAVLSNESDEAPIASVSQNDATLYM